MVSCMRITKNIKFTYLIIIIFFVNCTSKPKKNTTNKKITYQKTFALKRIFQDKVIHAVTDYNSINYFIYRGKPMGFHYELLKSFADDVGAELDLKISNDLDETFDLISDNDVDIAALDLTITNDRSKFISFTEPILETKQVLVQRKPENWQNMSDKQINDLLIRNQLDLGGKTIVIKKNSSFANRLKNLSEEMGEEINMVEDNELSVEQLIKMVSTGEIDYTVCDEQFGLVNQTYYPNIDVKTAISFPQKIAWAVNPGSDELLKELNSWLTRFKKTRKFSLLYDKYFRNKKSVRIFESEYFSVNSGKISEFDELFKKYSEQIGWDWRLLASLAYQESRFQKELVSWAGAFGLMQLMPETANRFGANINSPPEEQIKAGVAFIKYLDDRFSEFIDDPEERIHFILAAYNAGYGHVQDARRLANKNGLDSNIWVKNVDTFLLLKSVPKYYHDPVVKYGYMRGDETYNFVKEIMERFEHYKKVIPY
jgi:membrane-bound lytic murein transglycosylase F